MIDFQRGCIRLSDGSILTSVTETFEVARQAYSKLGLTITPNPYVADMIYVTGWKEFVNDHELSVAFHFSGGKLALIALQLDAGPSTSVGWDLISEKLLKTEIRLLRDIFVSAIGRKPDRVVVLGYHWTFPWGMASVSGETKSFSCGFFLSPKKATASKTG